ncbi:YhdP family protein [Pseudoxanthomonas dokdonensis]|uniref:Membrane protein n=1 Tax=Pseudoxanthomonas dokdonensis TaxID=344882 RepID=A0A0R0CTJ8_9GAMM|nr:YhdP family protein [Pseudoxanthomonas dokdonensis]KRG69057.1 membrane protein [Pseudoxanthomonas dokdonensis]
MPTPLRRRLRLARRGIAYGVALTLVCMALVLGIASQLLPAVERHPEQVAAWLSQRAGRPIAFDSLTTEWTRRGPLLQMQGLRIGSGAQAVRIGQAEMLVSMYGGLLPRRSFTELRLRQLALTLVRAADGSWSVQGLPGQRGGDPLRTLEGLGELQVIDGSLSILAPSLDWKLQLPDIDLRLRVDGQRVRAATLARIRKDAPPLRVNVDFDRQQGGGRAYAELDADDVGAWAPLLRFGGVEVDRGGGRLRGWARLYRHRVVMLTSDVQLRDLNLRGAPLALAGRSFTPTVQFKQLSARARWHLIAGGWRLDAPYLRVEDSQRAQKLDGLLLAMGQHNALYAQQLDAAPLLAVLGLSDRLTPGLRGWLLQARPGLRLSGLSLAAERGGAMRGSGRLQQLDFQPVGHAPGVSGLAGAFEGDSEGFQLQLDPQSKVRIDWPSGFGVSHEFALQGRLNGWRREQGWQIATSQLQAKGEDVGLQARGSLWFQGDGSRPWLDLAARVDDAPVVAAKGFWIHHSMPKAAVDWLNAALQGGQVRDGRALVSGDLDDWPFVAGNGRFEATARIDGGKVKFQPDWPAMEQLNARLRFIGAGFDVEGSGKLAAVNVDHLQAGIERFSQAHLRVDADTRSDAAPLLALLQHSPLRKSYADTLDNLQARGNVRASFHLLQPMHADEAAARKLYGDLDLSAARLSEKRWDLDFSGVSGHAEYSDHGFHAEGLKVSHDGLPGTLSLRAGDDTHDQRHAFEAQLQAPVAVDRLLDHAPEMAWLRPYAHGTSRWDVAVAVGREAVVGQAAAVPVQLTLQSDLRGTALTLPAPLDKPQAVALATRVSSALPLGQGVTEVAFGERLALRARSQAGKTGVRVELGSASVQELPPPEGLVVTGHTGDLDAMEWVALTRGGGQGSLALQHIDVLADRLLLLGSAFPQTRLQLAPAPAALAVSLEGPALAGGLLIPKASGEAISGRLARVHWRKAATGSSADGETVADADADTDATPFNPADVPPLALDIQELKFNDLALGQTHLRSRALADGMQLEQLQMRAPGQDIDLSGSWRGIGANADTRLQAHIDSRDYGALFAGIGYPGQLGGGEGIVKLDLHWPGSPAAFQLAALDGTANIALRDGHLLELEPGAGRVLGLLSVAEVRRRLTLDFSDFFSKGFAFNKVDGSVQLGDGNARSDHLVVDGPAAEIRIGGVTDLRNERFDQTIEVLPKSGNVLTAVGAVAAGPIGAAVGAVANAVLRKPLSEIGAKTYRVTGPWKNPQVETMGRERSKQEPPSASSPSSTIAQPGIVPAR